MENFHLEKPAAELPSEAIKLKKQIAAFDLKKKEAEESPPKEEDGVIKVAENYRIFEKGPFRSEQTLKDGTLLLVARETMSYEEVEGELESRGLTWGSSDDLSNIGLQAPLDSRIKTFSEGKAHTRHRAHKFKVRIDSGAASSVLIYQGDTIIATVSP